MVTGASAGRGGVAARGMALLAASFFVLALLLYLWFLLSQGGADGTAVELVAALLAVMAMTAGSAAFAPRRTVRLGLLSAVGVAATVLGVLAIFSIGLLLLIGAGTVAVAFLLTVLREPATVPRKDSIIASTVGCLAALGAIAAVVGPATAPHVHCLNSGASYSSGWSPFGETGRSSGGIIGSADGRTVTGVGDDYGHAYHFTCRDGKLVEFTHN